MLSFYPKTIGDPLIGYKCDLFFDEKLIFFGRKILNKSIEEAIKLSEDEFLNQLATLKSQINELEKVRLFMKS